MNDYLAVGIPLLAILLLLFAQVARPLGDYLAVKTHNERLGRIVAAAGRYAAEISDVLADLPAGAPVSMIKARLVAAAVSDLKAEFAASASAVGATDPKLQRIVVGELAKLPPKALAVAADLSTMLQVPAGETATQPASSPATPAPVIVTGATIPVVPVGVTP